METDPSVHIGTAELAKLLEESRRRAESAPDAADMHPHLAACPACREQFVDLALLDRQLDRQMKGMRPAESAPRQGDCPRPALWREIAGGLTPPGETLTYLEHASRCDHCGPLLRGAVAEVSDLNGEITEAERTLIAILESARAEWQQRLAQQIAGTQHPGRDRESKPWWKRWLPVPRLAVPRLAMVGAFLLAIVAAGSWVVIHRIDINNATRNQPAAAGKLLARAYTEKRTLELRIGGADYAPLRVSRGPAASFTSRPEPLLKAEALIASQLESHPSDPSWLQAKAQADVLEGKYDAAVEALRRALELEPHSPALLTDLATAYFQRAQQEDRKDDLGAAYEYLSQALRRHPDDPVALFNRAIVAEHQFLYHQALDDWDRYLQVDPRSDWTGEAREAADRLRTKLKDHDASQSAPLLSPAQIAASADGASGDDPNLHSTVDARIEEYLSGAVRSWLPQAYPEKGAADPAAQRALFFLADLTSQQHNDRWLSDLLRSSSARNFPQAVAALARAVNATDIAEYDVSRRQAELAEQLFRAGGNIAGALRAQFEQTYAAQIERHSETCRRKATAALTESERYSYPWLQIQLGLEEGICSGLMNDLGTQKEMAQRAIDRAQKNGYGGLDLRSLFFAADEKIVAGDPSSAWRLSIVGLQRYWSGQYPSMQVYNLYTDLAYDAGSRVQFNLQVALWREAIAVLGSDTNLQRLAAAHELLAHAAQAAHQPRLAEQQYAEAARFYALAPQSEASRSIAIENQIRNAQLESRQGQLESALGRLVSVQDQIRPLSNNYLVQMFYSVLGELQLRRHREVEAERALQPALNLAEQSLASLGSEAERFTWKNDAAPVYLALTEAKLLQGNPQESLEAYEWYLGASQGASPARPSLPQPSRLALRLPLLFRETLLVYAALPDGLAIWVCDDSGVYAEWIAKPTDQLQELAARFYDLASDPKSNLSALRRDGRSLYTALILPIEKQLTPGRTLVIEADGWLARVPFEALVDAQNHYLIERWPVVHSLGQDSDAGLRNSNDSDKGDAGPISARMPLLVVASAASSQEEGLPPLIGVAEEADAVASGFHSPRVLKGSEATLRAVKESLPSAAVFHFAGHSFVTPDRSGLLLENAHSDGPRTGTPSLLDAAAVRKLNVGNMELAFLSACNTESGAGSSGGFNSVTEALLRAGVPHVIASRWDVVETRAFIGDFYRSAFSGQLVSEAIRGASRNMLADPRTAHPYYWSAFAAYGRP